MGVRKLEQYKIIYYKSEAQAKRSPQCWYWALVKRGKGHLKQLAWGEEPFHKKHIKRAIATAQRNMEEFQAEGLKVSGFPYSAKLRAKNGRVIAHSNHIRNVRDLNDLIFVCERASAIHVEETSMPGAC